VFEFVLDVSGGIIGEGSAFGDRVPIPVGHDIGCVPERNGGVLGFAYGNNLAPKQASFLIGNGL
jgi:hypothetical protein